MAPIGIKLVATPVALLLHIAAGLMAIGIAQREFGGPSGTEFPYALPLLLTVAPLMVSIWWKGAAFWRRVVAWATGTTLTVATFAALHPVALKAFAWDAVYGDPYSLGAVWPLAGASVGALLAGVISTRMVLRFKRGATS
jgi:hypothetical protein